MLEPDENGVMMQLAPSPMRRAIAVGALYALGGLLLWMAAARPPTPLVAAALIGIGLLALWAGESLRRSTRTMLELTEEGLRDSTGRMLARWDEIAKVERGAFALKPSNGFSLITHQAATRAWVPGLWWRIGRRVGVGGVLPMRATKFMAEQIALKLASAGGR